jgi:hypothetical protein
MNDESMPVEEQLNLDVQLRMREVLEAKRNQLRGVARARTEKLRLDTEVAQLREAVIAAQQAADEAQERLMSYQLGEGEFKKE